MSTDDPRKAAKRLNGHVGHLSPGQEEAFNTFKSILQGNNLYTPVNEENINPKPSDDDATLLRFLRARRWDPSKALKQFSDTVTWRRENDVDNLFANFDTDEFESSRRFYPRWTGRRDRQGLPLYVYRLGSLTPTIQNEIHSTPKQRRFQRIVALWEVMRRFILPLCTYLPHESAPTPISSITTIIDLEDASLRQMWNLRSHLQEASELATANYPETINTIAVVNSPSFFPTIWGWIKIWFDEGTRNKVYVLGKDPGETLRDIIHAKDLPKAYGGELDWKFEDEPSLDDETKKVIDEMPKGPFIFEDGAVKRPKEYKAPEPEQTEK